MRTARARLVIGACVLFGACIGLTGLGGCGGGGGAAAKPKAAVGPAIDSKQAERGASDLVADIYETLDRGNKDSLFTLLDDALIVFGPRGVDMLGTRADALVALGQVVDPKAKKKVTLRPSKLEVVTSPGGRSAWAFDVVNVNGEPLAVMSVLTNSDDIWLVGAVALAHTPTAAQVKAELAKDAVVPPGSTGVKRIDPAARPAVEKFQKGLLEQELWGDELAQRSDSIVIGPTSGEVTRGKKEIKALWKKRVEAKTRAAISGEITAGVTEDGQLAWVSLPLTRVEAERDPLPLRAFAVYERDGGDWKLIALHEMIAFGEPGAGAPFKKIVPPKLPEPKPEVIEPKDEPKAAKVATDKPKKKKKKKAKLVEDEAPKKVKKKKKKVADEDPAEADEAPKKLKKKKVVDEAEADEAPKKKKKVVDEDPAEADEAPKKKKKQKVVEADEAGSDSASASDSDEAPKKKKKKKPVDDDE